MRQLILDVRPDWIPGLDDFVPGQNTDLLAALLTHASAQDGSALYLWGAPGSGRTHLLRALVARAAADGRPARYLAAPDLSADWTLETGELLALDDVQTLDAAAQSALFRTFIGARAAGGALLLAGHAAPQALQLREDVRTRIGQGLIFEIKPLDDDDKARTLRQHAAQRGMSVDTALVGYLLRHGRRDLPWLMSVLDALDEASLTHGRRITLPLLREILRDATSSQTE